jgi:YesN/AraC family two-component response regulator
VETSNSTIETTTVLIVDDEEDIEIQSGEYVFHFARNGQEALERVAETTSIDIVVTDVNMPQMNGFELLLKMRDKHPAIKTVIISAYSDEQSIKTATKSGAAAFISKPLDFKELQSTLKNLGRNA